MSRHLSVSFLGCVHDRRLVWNPLGFSLVLPRVLGLDGWRLLSPTSKPFSPFIITSQRIDESEGENRQWFAKTFPALSFRLIARWNRIAWLAHSLLELKTIPKDNVLVNHANDSTAGYFEEEPAVVNQSHLWTHRLFTFQW